MAGSSHHNKDEAGSSRHIKDEAGSSRHRKDEAGSSRHIKDEAGSSRHIKDEAGSSRHIKDEAGNFRLKLDALVLHFQNVKRISIVLECICFAFAECETHFYCVGMHLLCICRMCLSLFHRSSQALPLSLTGTPRI